MGQIVLKIKSYYELSYSWIVTILIASMGFFAVPAADDFCNYNKIHSFSHVYQYVWDLYLGWTGRVLSTYGIGLVFKYLNLNDVRFISCALGVTFCLASYYFVSLVVRKSNLASIWFISSIVTAYFFIFIKRDLVGEIVYWPTGGIVYIFPIALGAYFLNSIEQEEDKFKIKNIIVGFLVGGALENLTIAILGYLGVQFLFELLLKGKTNKVKKYLVYIFVIIAGAVVLFAAPGNFKRAVIGKQSFNLNLSFLIESYFNILKNYSEVVARTMSIFIILAIVYAGISIYKRFISKNNSNDKEKLTIENEYLQRGISLCLGGLATILPMIFVSEFVASRTASLFLYFMFFGFLPIFTFLFSTLHIDFKKSYITIFSILILVIFSFKITNYFIDNAKFLTEYKQRESLILASTSQDLIVKPIKNKTSKHVHFIELTTDKDHWINACTATYYKKNSIRIESL